MIHEPVSVTSHTCADRGAVRRNVFAAALAAWSIAYVLPHLYWGLGGTLGLSAVKPTASALEDWRAINLAASGVLVLPAVIAVALIRGRPGRTRSSVLVVTVVGAAIAASHGIYGITYRALMIAGVIDVDGEPFDLSRHGWVIWDLVVFEPWFLIEGVLFAGAGGAAVAAESRRRWTVVCAIAVTAATLTGIAGVRV